MLSNESVNNTSYNEVFDGLQENGQVTFDVYFYASNRSVNLLHSVICKVDGKFVFTEEYLKSKLSVKIKNKADIFAFDQFKPVLKRSYDEAFLLDDVSIMVAFNKSHKDNFSYHRYAVVYEHQRVEHF